MDSKIKDLEKQYENIVIRTLKLEMKAFEITDGKAPYFIYELRDIREQMEDFAKDWLQYNLDQEKK